MSNLRNLALISPRSAFLNYNFRGQDSINRGGMRSCMCMHEVSGCRVCQKKLTKRSIEMYPAMTITINKTQSCDMQDCTDGQGRGNHYPTYHLATRFTEMAINSWPPLSRPSVYFLWSSSGVKSNLGICCMPVPYIPHPLFSGRTLSLPHVQLASSCSEVCSGSPSVHSSAVTSATWSQMVQN